MLWRGTMKESMKNGRRVISLVTEKELRTYMHPLRQKIRSLTLG